ncbi:MAG: efflux RND transporter permease subunit [Armatimonadetes bacterium]|nr:efflux RND transporter permease subunit [Armatimonadota bacterium]
MWLTNVSIRRPIFLIMFVLALVVLGLRSRSTMPQEYNPKIDIPYVTVVTTYPGAGPSEIETLVSEPIEKAVTSTGGLKNVTSSSQDGVSSVALEFELGTNLEAATADVRDKVAAIRTNLPKDIDEPRILKLDIASMPIMIIALEGPLSAKEMRILADDVVSDKLAKVSGVASVNPFGGDERELSISVDKDRLDAYGIGIDQVIGAIRGANLNIPAGSIKEGARDTSIRTVGEYRNVSEIEETRINVNPAGGGPSFTVRIADVAEVKDTVAEADVLTRLDGTPAVVFAIQKQSDANTVAVADGIKKELEALKSELPTGVKPVIAVDQSKFVTNALRDVNRSLLEGVLLVVLIVFLFLHTARATFIVAIAIPTSLMATFIPISGFGFTQNQMVLLALSLVVGILVDDSIVVLENIERHLRLRENPEQAAINGRSEIGLAAITITSVDIVVFLPIAFMGGIVGQFFRQFGVTVATATAFSLLMSFTLTPMLASKWMRSEDDKEADEKRMLDRIQHGQATLKDRIDYLSGMIFGVLERFLRGLDRKYRGVLEWALHNRYLTIVIGFVSLLTVLAMAMPMPSGAESKMALIPRIVIAMIGLLLCAIAFGVNPKSKKIALIFAVVAAFIAMKIHIPFGFGFFPVVDQGQFSVQIRTAPGTSLEATDKVAKQLENVLGQLPEMKPITRKVRSGLFKKVDETQQGYYMTLVGTSSQSSLGGGSSGPQYAVISAKVVDKSWRKRSLEDITEWVAEQAAKVPGAEMISVSISFGMGPSNNIEKEVQGHDMDSILEEANRVAAVMEKTPGAVDVDVSFKPSRPERRIVVDRLKAAQLNLTVSQVAMGARMAIDGDNTVKFRDSGTEYPIRVQYSKAMRDKASDVDNLIISSKDGAPIYLSDVADIIADNAPTKIDRKNRQRVVYVTANLAQGAEMGNVNQAIDAGLNKTEHVVGTTVGTGGATQMMGESFGHIGAALLLAILLVYMLMGALFESFLTPFVIMFSLPQAMVGALLALLLTGNSMSIVAMIGIIMLMGLVTKNAILLVDYTNTLISRGKNRHDAILEAGPTRLRPILMTTFAMIGGMLPTALALSEGSETRSPMSIAVIGGLILSTLLTLIVIPVMFTIVDDLWQWIRRTVTGRTSRDDLATAEQATATTAGADLD